MNKKVRALGGLSISAREAVTIDSVVELERVRNEAAKSTGQLRIWRCRAYRQEGHTRKTCLSLAQHSNK